MRLGVLGLGCMTGPQEGWQGGQGGGLGVGLAPAMVRSLPPAPTLMFAEVGALGRGLRRLM